ncbi:flagellar hook-associated protein 3 FlgL [Malonomonas rubra DSM 5091]|uniref:Flagellar hook-associated protein 3 FlgL n=1 Tax=Malonomonas rubra DSM 5091 TaxID=1122189 RepID=A0A1M6MAZ6_MALRU|nr:flagellar hook-associated protein FlgL [Malonomonas rubra]SHJ80473.1 flagellar hook-associated protein 3 FlgL [Malonomonas rubra DSM 5091]
MRATQTTTYRSLQAFLDRTSDKLASLQLQAATGKKLNRPSDDPTAISPVLSARTQIMASDRYIETIESGLDRVDNMDGYLDGMENTLIRLKEIAIAAGNGALSASDRLTYADEVASLKEELMVAGNAQVDGKYLFAGFSEKTTPFVSNPAYPGPGEAPVLYNGDAGSVEFEISPNELIEVNLTGNDLLLGDSDNDGVTDPGAIDIFAVITTVEEALRANDPDAVVAELDNIESAANQVRRHRSIKGNVGRRLETALDHMEQIKIDMETFRSRFEDADILETITSMEQQQQSFQAALNVTGKVSELSILDYI